MKAKEENLLRFLGRTDTQFIIPVYQRNYDWKKEQCEQLFNDIERIKTKELDSHFLGSIVTISDDDTIQVTDISDFLVIDGQQRLTTVSLILIAMYRYLARKEQVNSKTKKEQILNLYLINEYKDDEEKIKLKPIKGDHKAFKSLITEGNCNNFFDDSNITKNYKYFEKRIDESFLSIDNLYNAIKRLVIVTISLKRNEDDPQLIFESLNSTGLNLSGADLIRNFILMDKKAEEQEKFYNEYWSIMEKYTHFKVTDFVRDFLSYRERVTPNKGKVYPSFKNFVKNNYQNKTEELLKELLKFSKFYEIIAFSNDENPLINELLRKINKLDITVSYPFLLEIFDDYDRKLITEGEVVKILKLIETYVVRRMVCDVPSNALNKIFVILGKEVKKKRTRKEDYVGIMEFVLANKQSTQRLPNNEEFSEKIIFKDVYSLKSKNKIFLLESIENFKNKERVDVENLVNEKELSVEHIMPQKLNRKWKINLGNNWEEIHSKWLNSIGNITLTGYNSEMSNKIFTEKRDSEKGFKESRLYINNFLKDLEKWGEEEIKKRANILKERALEVWPYPKVDKSIELSDKVFYDLSEDKDFTSTKPESFEILGKKYCVNSWKDFYQEIAKELYELDANIFRTFLYDNDFKRKNGRHVADNESVLSMPVKISKSLFLESRLSANSILQQIRLIVTKYDLEEEDIIFYLKK